MVVIACIAVILSSAPNKSSTVAWSTDLTKARTVLPGFLSGIQKVTWVVVIEEDRSGGFVPGPSSYATMGFAIVDKTTIDILNESKEFVGNESSAKDFLSHLSDISIKEGRIEWNRFVKLKDQLSGTNFVSGELLFCPDTRLVFFRLVKD
jgi:hypothetical protein